MRTYGQYCPISRAAEILAERWTLLLVRNLLLGCTSFNEIAQGVPGMSRSLLKQRLDGLADAGVVEIRKKPRGRGSIYELTAAGRSLWDVVAPMAAWGERWLDLRREHSDPSIVLWGWVRLHLRRDRLPRRRVVVQFDFPDQPRSHRRFWLLVEHGDAELCDASPGFPNDLVVTARSEAFMHWHVGTIEWREAVRRGEIRVEGPRALARALPQWNDRAVIRKDRAEIGA